MNPLRLTSKILNTDVRKLPQRIKALTSGKRHLGMTKDDLTKYVKTRRAFNAAERARIPATEKPWRDGRIGWFDPKNASTGELQQALGGNLDDLVTQTAAKPKRVYVPPAPEPTISPAQVDYLARQPIARDTLKNKMLRAVNSTTPGRKLTNALTQRRIQQTSRNVKAQLAKYDQDKKIIASGKQYYANRQAAKNADKAMNNIEKYRQMLLNGEI
jgi:hypothetical protein